MSHRKSVSLSSLLHPLFSTAHFPCTLLHSPTPLLCLVAFQNAVLFMSAPRYFGNRFTRLSYLICCLHLFATLCSSLFFVIPSVCFFILFFFVLHLPNSFFFCLPPLGHMCRVILNNSKRSLPYFQDTCPFLPPPVF